MKMKKATPKRISVMVVTIVLLMSNIFGSMTAYAGDAVKLPIAGDVCEPAKNSQFVIEENSPTGASPIGTLSIEGNVETSSELDSLQSYEVSRGNALFSYEINEDVLDREGTEWHLVEDGSTKVNGQPLPSKVGRGALILQTSLDREHWTADVRMTDIFKESVNTNGFYETKDIQLQNGCYYRVYIAYKMERRVADSKVLFVTTQNYEQKKVVEAYEFYVFTETDETKPDTEPMKILGEKINTGLDNGYSGNKPIDKGDPHYGWDIGYFFVNGYTREATASDGTPVFLKNVGDKVTLWFHLTEDINQLQGNKLRTICKDTNGYDLGFESNPTNFERGALIIQYTNPQGKNQPPIIYTDYLAANARTGANTKVQLFEEGDYTVSLDYEIQSMGGIANSVAYFTNYKILFQFSIRNGNCMVYPFDLFTGAELSNNAITESGFKLDMAKSKYLTIDVRRSVPVVGADGRLTEDIRFNGPARDGEEYSDEGIYTFTVKNLYTGEKTEKTIYVGDSNYLKALSSTGMSIAELNDQIESGAIVHEDGRVGEMAFISDSAPAGTESESVSTVEDETTESLAEMPNPDDVPTDDVSEEQTDETTNRNPLPWVIVGIAAAILCALTVILWIKRPNGKGPRKIKKEDTEE